MPRKRPPSKKCTHKGCKAYSEVGRLYCWRHRHHGEMIGSKAPNFKHGRYSSALPAHLKPAYEKSLGDEHLLALRDEISVLDARSHELQQRLGTGESGEAWKAVREAIATLQAAISAKDGSGIFSAIETLKTLADEGVGETAQWSEIQRVFKLRKELVEAESKRLLQLRQYMSLEKAVLLVELIATAVNEEVEDQSSREAIVKKLETLLNYNPNSNAAQRERAERLEQHHQQEAEFSGLF